MLETILDNDKNIQRRQIWHVLREIEFTEGEEDFGRLSVYGMEEGLDRYMKGIFNEKIHRFYEKYAHKFLGCEGEEKLRNSRQKFNKDINNGIIRY